MSQPTKTAGLEAERHQLGFSTNPRAFDADLSAAPIQIRSTLFHPLVPLVCIVAALDVGDQRLLASGAVGPFDASAHLFAELPDQRCDTLRRALEILFATNGRPELGAAVVETLPSSVRYIGLDQLGVHGDVLAQVREWYWSALPSVLPRDLVRTVQLLRDHPRDSWRALGGAEDVDAILTGARGVPWPPERVVFDEWFERVSEPAHVQSHRAQLSQAWDYAFASVLARAPDRDAVLDELWRDWDPQLMARLVPLIAHIDREPTQQPSPDLIGEPASPSNR